MASCRLLPLVIAAVLCSGRFALAAEGSFPITFAVGTQSLTVPWHPGQATRRVNPTLRAGTDYTLSSWRRFRFYTAANLTLILNHWWMTGVALASELGIGCKLPFGIHTDVRIGAGYMHIFWRRETLKLEDGAYQAARDPGLPSLYVPVSFVIGYRGYPARPLAVAPFVCGQWGVQAMFLEEVPVLPHLLLLVGARVDLERAAAALWSP